MKPPAEPPASVYQNTARALSLNTVLQTATEKIGEVEFYHISVPKDSVGAYSVTVLPRHSLEMASNTYYFDQYSGTIIGTSMFSDKNLGQRVRSTFKPVHTGSIFGIYSKIIAFITCLLGATFPVTGTTMWILRLRKKKRSRMRNIKIDQIGQLVKE
jgi:uncharacterized iron-regulated membrane protein